MTSKTTLNIAEKLAKVAPYNILQNTLICDEINYEEDENWPSIKFSEIFDPALGELESSICFTAFVDLDWLLSQYTAANIQDKPLDIVCRVVETIDGELSEDQLKAIMENNPNIKIDTPNDGHTSKIIIFKYQDKSLRIVVPCADFTNSCWEESSTIVWISDRLPALNESSDTGESITNFKSDLLEYLTSYDKDILQPWIESIKSVDFSDVNVCFVGSVPGKYSKNANEHVRFGHPKVRSLLSQYSAAIKNPLKCPIVSQCVQLGASYRRGYLHKELGVSLCADSSSEKTKMVPDFNLIYPSLNNMNNCLSTNKFIAWYRLSDHKHQRWIEDYLYQWKSYSTQKDRAQPKMRTISRWCDEGIYWFMMGSHNLIPNVMGTYYDPSTHELDDTLRISRYGVGLLFLPRLMISKDHFPMTPDQCNGYPVFHLPYKVRLTPYEPKDQPYAYEDCQSNLKS